MMLDLEGLKVHLAFCQHGKIKMRERERGVYESYMNSFTLSTQIISNLNK